MSTVDSDSVSIAKVLGDLNTVTIILTHAGPGCNLFFSVDKTWRMAQQQVFGNQTAVVRKWYSASQINEVLDSTAPLEHALHPGRLPYYTPNKNISRNKKDFASIIAQHGTVEHLELTLAKKFPFVDPYTSKRMSMVEVGQSAVDRACYSGNISVLELLIDKKGIGTLDAKAVLSACEGGSPEAIEFSLHHGFRICIAIYKQMLSAAIRYGRVNVVDFIADPTKFFPVRHNGNLLYSTFGDDETRENMMDLALNSGNKGMVEYLFDSWEIPLPEHALWSASRIGDKSFLEHVWQKGQAFGIDFISTQSDFFVRPIMLGNEMAVDWGIEKGFSCCIDCVRAAKICGHYVIMVKLQKYIMNK